MAGDGKPEPEWFRPPKGKTVKIRLLPPIGETSRWWEHFPRPSAAVTSRDTPPK